MLERLDLRGSRADLAAVLAPPTAGDEPVAAVREIVGAVRDRGDRALRELTERFDGCVLDELSTLGTQIDELTSRILAVADSYDGTPNAAISTELYAVERALVTARRTLDRASESLTNLNA